jgi:hypothetical protein
MGVMGGNGLNGRNGHNHLVPLASAPLAVARWPRAPPRSKGRKQKGPLHLLFDVFYLLLPLWSNSAAIHKPDQEPQKAEWLDSAE